MTRLLWTQRTNFGPRPRVQSAMTYDSSRGRTVLFGGSISANQFAQLGDTWEWDGSFWTQMQDIGPAPRLSPAMDYDPGGQVCVLFGGGGVSGNITAAPLGDTWQWDGSDWTQVSESGPAARFGHAVAFDSGRNRLVLFGGQPNSGGSTYLSDTWEFDGANWTQQEDTGPSPRTAHTMAYDGVGRVILFGGNNANQVFDDTWAWNGQDWIQIAEFGPSARTSCAMAGAIGNLVLYGGLGTSVATLALATSADTWEFDGKLWTQRQDIGPGPLMEASMAFDSARATVVLFGGQNSTIASASPSGSTWEAAVPAQSIVSVMSLIFPSEPVPGSIGVDFVQPMTVTLSGLAPSGGSVVNLIGAIFDANGNALTTVTVPAGLNSLTSNVQFKSSLSPVGTTVVVEAQISTTPAVTVALQTQLNT